jgi:hypothetical protein
MPFDETLSAAATERDATVAELRRPADRLDALPPGRAGARARPRGRRQRAAMSPTGFSLAAFLVAAVLAGGPAPARAQELLPLRGSSTLLTVGAPAALLPGFDAYGPGINADATGRPFVFVTPLGAPLGGVRLNVYGPGIGADATGWPVYVRPWP